MLGSRQMSALKGTLDDMGDGAHEGYDRWQSETATWRDRLLLVAQASTDYAGAELKNETQELVIYSVADPTDAMAALIRAASPTIRVTWRNAPHTLAELLAEVRRLMAEQPGRLVSASPRIDGTGIWSTTTDAELLATDDPQASLGARYPISVEYGEPPSAI